MARKPRPEPRSAHERTAEHKRQVRLQIWLPLIFGILVAVGLAGLAVAGTVMGSAAVNRWGNLSAVYLLIPHLLVTLIPLAVLFLSIYGMHKLAGKMPGWLSRLQGIFALIAIRARQAADKLAAPVISLNSARRGLDGIFHTRFGRRN